MRKLFAVLALSVLALSVRAQTNEVITPRFDYFKQTVTFYTDSAFKNKKVVSLDMLKFKLLEWKNGGWKVAKRRSLADPVEIVYMKDDQFIKTPEYRRALESYDPSFKQKHQAYYQTLLKAYGKKIGNGIFFGVPTVGMTMREFYMCMDRPNEDNVTQTAYGTSHQLVYRNGQSGTKYYYFRNGKLTTIQD